MDGDAEVYAEQTLSSLVVVFGIATGTPVKTAGSFNVANVKNLGSETCAMFLCFCVHWSLVGRWGGDDGDERFKRFTRAFHHQGPPQWQCRVADGR